MEKKLKVFTAFSGYDSQCLGLNRLKDYDKTFDYELVGWSEIDRGAITAHDALFPEYTDRNYGDISKVDWNTVPDFDLFTYSSPCFVRNTIIDTKPDDSINSNRKISGKYIQDIKVGDYVLTHNGQYKKVTETFVKSYPDNLLKIKMYGYEDYVICTKNHPFYVQNDKDSEPHWVAAEDLTVDDIWVVNKQRCLRFHALVINRDLKERAYKHSLFNINKIESIEVIENPNNDCLVYNIEVEDDHSYVANGFVVHNCTDFSTAGKQAGGEEGSGTRSSLLWECKKTILAKHPDYLLFENVPAILQKKFIDGFENWLKFLRQEGYNNYWAILNSADYGVPQNRERLFVVSIKNTIDQIYTFPGPLDSRPHLYEILQPDSEVDPKFIRSEWRRTHYIEMTKDALDKLDNPENSALDYSVIPMGVYCHASDAFIAPPLYDISRTLKTESIEAGIIYKKPNEKNGDWQMRLFTQRECFRLMGLTDEEIDKFDGKVKQTHQSRCAGNSIVVNVLFHIFRRMFTDIDKPDKNTTQPLF